MAKKTTHRKAIKVLKKKPLKAKKPKKQEEIKAPNEPTFHVCEHSLVSKHEVLTQEDVEKLFVDVSVSPQHLPVIFINDPALEGMDIKMGDIIRITRKSPTAGIAIYYRRVAYE